MSPETRWNTARTLAIAFYSLALARAAGPPKILPANLAAKIEITHSRLAGRARTAGFGRANRKIEPLAVLISGGSRSRFRGDTAQRGALLRPPTPSVTRCDHLGQALRTVGMREPVSVKLSNRSAARRNGNWKLASRDWRRKYGDPGPKISNFVQKRRCRPCGRPVRSHPNSGCAGRGASTPVSVESRMDAVA
jgi:hypothetical protein